MSQRRAKRVSVRLPVSIGRRAALSADISDQGFCLETTTALPQGARVSGFVLHGTKELSWTGRVAWVVLGNPMTSLWHKMGIELLEVSPGLRALLSLRQRG